MFLIILKMYGQIAQPTINFLSHVQINMLTYTLEGDNGNYNLKI